MTPTTTMQPTPPTLTTPTSTLGRLGQSPPLLALLGAALLWAGWPTHPAPLTLLLFVGFVPYLRLEQVLTERRAKRGQVFAYTYLFLVLWNAFTTWWVSYSTLGGGIAAVVLNAALMCVPLMAFRRTKERLGAKMGYFSLPIYWIAFEQLHLHWDVTWPWLTLGNGFASVPTWVQWYEYTGFLGGSVWVWVVNILIFWAWSGRRYMPHWANSGPVFAIGLPIIISLGIGRSYQEKGVAAEVLVVQPNVDPYEEKFPGTARFIAFDEQLRRLLARTEQNLTPQTRLVLWPETTLDETYFENTFDREAKVQRIRQELLARHPGLSLLAGITSVIRYPDKEHATVTARYRDDLGYYDVFNTAAFFPDATAPAQFYHKSRLVPGVEKIPPMLAGVLKNIDLGGVAGSYGSQEERTVFTAPSVPALRLAPIICYESIYGDFIAQYAHNGGTLLGIITNDGWWSDSPGHEQHLVYGALRAIEARRDVARSANTGISGFVNQHGEITQRTGWWVGAAARTVVHLNEEQTFYVRYGELIGRGAQGLAVLLVLGAIAVPLVRKQ
jgi:apolipoprotein N-acyltransferase